MVALRALVVMLLGTVLFGCAEKTPEEKEAEKFPTAKPLSSAEQKAWEEKYRADHSAPR